MSGGIGDPDAFDAIDLTHSRQSINAIGHSVVTDCAGQSQR
jgi:hypothetical protein